MAKNALSAVALIMVAVWLGAYSAQYYMWTAPFAVKRLTYSITTDNFIENVITTGTKIFGSHPTGTTAAVPAQDASTGDNATLILPENLIVHFTVSDGDAAALANRFKDLTINICVYERGLVNALPHDNLDLQVVVSGVAQTNIDNRTTVLNFENKWDPVITLLYTTGNKSGTGNIVIGVYAVEA
jgi:hypothetical protein